MILITKCMAQSNQPGYPCVWFCFLVIVPSLLCVAFVLVIAEMIRLHSSSEALFHEVIVCKDTVL